MIIRIEITFFVIGVEVFNHSVSDRVFLILDGGRKVKLERSRASECVCIGAD